MDSWVDQARKKREIDHIPKYGVIHPKTDPRCFRKEALLECLDFLNYVEWGMRKGELTVQQRRLLDSGIKKMIKILEGACADKFDWELSWMK